MMAQPVNPARKMEEMRPRRRGNKFVMCSCERWKHMPPAPRSTVPACRALKCLVFEKPSRKSAVMLRQVPAEVISTCGNIVKLLLCGSKNFEYWEIKTIQFQICGDVHYYVHRKK